MRLTQRVSLFFTNQLTLALLACAFVAHVVFLSVFTHQFSSMRHNNIEQSILNLFSSLSLTADDQEKLKIINNTKDDNIKFSLSATPKGKQTIKNLSDKILGERLADHLSDFDLSIYIEKGQWLNAKSSIKSRLFYQEELLIVFEILVFGAIFISAWSVRRFTRPLKRFKSAAERLGVDLHSAPMDLYGPKVVRETAQAMNQMQNRIKDLIRDRTQMMAAISHDLRTPITRMKLRLQLLEKPKVSQACVQDLDEMNEMIAAVMNFARHDAHHEEKKKIDISSMVNTICDDAQDMGFNVHCDLPEKRITVLARPVDIKRAIINVINNACRYGKKVVVSLQLQNKKVIIRIVDDGPGIPHNEISRVFEPFYRADKSRSRDTGGVGLGLAVTQGIIQAHGGRVTLKNVEPHGLKVEMRLPFEGNL
jgi:signal transduction histidine kinase